MKGVTSHHLLWFPDGTHLGHYEAPEVGAVAQDVCKGIIIQLKSNLQISVICGIIIVL